MDKALSLHIKGNVDIYIGDSWPNRIYTLIRNKKNVTRPMWCVGKEHRFFFIITSWVEL